MKFFSMMKPAIQTQEYQIQRILDRRIRNSTIEYYVKWKNFSHENSTWQPIWHLKGALLTLFKFEKTASKIFERRRKRRSEMGMRLGMPRYANELKMKKEIKMHKNIMEPIVVESDEEMRKVSSPNRNRDTIEAKFRNFSLVSPIQIEEDLNQSEIVLDERESKTEKEEGISTIPRIIPRIIEARGKSNCTCQRNTNELYVMTYKSGNQVKLTQQEFSQKHPRKFESYMRQGLEHKRE